MRILTALGEGAITTASYPLASYQVSKENEGKAVVGHVIVKIRVYKK